MVAEPDTDRAVARIAAAIGEPARARILFCLMDRRARTSTELAVVAEVAPSTASAHLARLHRAGLVTIVTQGRHRYYTLRGPEVARALEGLSALAGRTNAKFLPKTPHRLRHARTCYDHLAGTLGVQLCERFQALGWLSAANGQAFGLTAKGTAALSALGLDLATARGARRGFAVACLDWSERRAHLGGALGAAFLDFALRKKWFARDLDSRALSLTSLGRRELAARFGLQG